MRIVSASVAAAVVVAAVLIWLNQPEATPDSAIDFTAIPQNGTVLGSSDAPVQIVEFADYQCPVCGQFANEVVPQIIEDFVVTGKATFEFQAFPFLGATDPASPGNESVQAAEAAMCALDQGKFWEYNHLLFENQDGENDGAFSDEHLKAFAAELGLDQATFDTCLDSGTHQQQVLDEFADGQASGVNSTPTILINGQPVYYTTQGYDLLKRQIEAAIAGEPIPQ
jgi:protein-disulfide isomerase